jgi:hypothetical protein
LIPPVERLKAVDDETGEIIGTLVFERRKPKTEEEKKKEEAGLKDKNRNPEAHLNQEFR